MSSDAPRYRIGFVAQKTGLSTHTLRAWERRYGSITPGRAGGGGRLYSDRDVSHLKLLRQLTEQGHAIGSIAQLSLQELAQLAHDDAATSQSEPLSERATEQFRERFLSAILSFDLAAASRVLAQAALLLAPRELVCDLLAPLLHEIGARWEAGSLAVAHEHAASALLRSELGALLRTLGNRDGPTLVAATLPGEMHEFGALLAALFAAAQGWRVLYLGANLPAAEIAAAARHARARLVLISVVNDADALSAGELRKLCKALPREVTLCVGGRGTARRARWPESPSIHYVQSLSELSARLS